VPRAIPLAFVVASQGLFVALAGAETAATAKVPASDAQVVVAPVDPNEVIEFKNAPPVRRHPRSDAIGSLSIGKPNLGYLMNGVRLPNGAEWVVTVPQHAFGTEETVAQLVYALRRVSRAFPATPPVMIGSLSPERGGAAPPHKSHRTGRDVDVYLYRLSAEKGRWAKPATAEDLDRPRVWALMRTLILECDVEFILLDERVQALIVEYALSAGEDPDFVHALFDGAGPYRPPIVKHIPGHTAHLHVRFLSPVAREQARDAYPALADRGYIKEGLREVNHEVVRGDTLIAIARQYQTTPEALKSLNTLEGDAIFVGQKLRVQERKDVIGALDPIQSPWRPHAPSLRSLEALAASPFDPKAFLGATGLKSTEQKPTELGAAALPELPNLSAVSSAETAEESEAGEPAPSRPTKPRPGLRAASQ
jgi:LysM repeat protein/murein endopeptidase